MSVELFGIELDFETLRIPLTVLIAVLSLIFVFFLTSRIIQFALIVIFVVALGLIGWWGYQAYF